MIRNFSLVHYLAGMLPTAYQFCVPTQGQQVPSGPDWLHEVKYDGYRLRVERDGDRVRLITRGGNNWTSRYPWIAEAARKVRQSQFVLDGEAVVLGVDGVSDFNALHSRKHDHEVQFCAFDIMVDDGEDVRKLPLSIRKMNLERLLRRRPDGIFVNPFERGEIGPALFEAACRMGLEGLVSKHRDRAYRAGRCDHWIKVKNRTHPAMAGDGVVPITYRRREVFGSCCHSKLGHHADGRPQHFPKPESR